MESLIIRSTDITPEVICDAEKGTIEMFGRLIPENANEIYLPILNWTKEFDMNGSNSLHFVFFLDYINSISYKMLFELMLYAEEMKKKGKDISVLWKYEEDDDEILEEGKTFSSKIDIEFTFEEVPEE